MDGSEEIFEFSPVIDGTKGGRRSRGARAREQTRRNKGGGGGRGGGREERIGTIPLTGAHIPHREGPEGKGAQVPALPCVSLWARGTRFWRGFPRNRARTLVENGWGRERKADRERERERDRGACSVPIF